MQLFLARLLFLIKKGGLLQYKVGVDHLLVGAITWKVIYISFPIFLCMLLMTSSRTSSMMADKIWRCRRDNFKFNNGGGLMSSVLLLLYRSLFF